MSLKELLFYEVDFHVSFEGSYQVINFETFDEGATLDGVVFRRDYSGSRAGGCPTLLIRDRGDAGKTPSCPRYAIVVRRMGRATPIPQACGPFVGRFESEGWEWYVFAPRKVGAPPAAELVNQIGRAPKLQPAQPAPLREASASSPSPVPDIVEAPSRFALSE